MVLTHTCRPIRKEYSLRPWYKNVLCSDVRTEAVSVLCVHQFNTLLRDIFGLGAPLILDTGLKSTSRISRFEKVNTHRTRSVIVVFPLFLVLHFYLRWFLPSMFDKSICKALWLTSVRFINTLYLLNCWSMFRLADGTMNRSIAHGSIPQPVSLIPFNRILSDIWPSLSVSAQHLFNSAAFKARTKIRNKVRDKRADVM